MDTVLFKELAAKTGDLYAKHSYSHFNQPVPDTRYNYLTVRANGTWNDVINAKPGDAVYTDIVRWAQAIKSRPGRVMLAYHHEPEAKYSVDCGTADQDVAADRRVHDIFAEQGVTNVDWTWQMTGYAFTVNPNDRRYPTKWYPGDAYVDVVSADTYTGLGTCVNGTGNFVPLGPKIAPQLTFARAHSKSAVLAEWAAPNGPQREQWLRDASQFFIANSDVITAVYYFNRSATHPENGDCAWQLQTDGEFSIFASLARDTAHYTNGKN